MGVLYKFFVFCRYRSAKLRLQSSMVVDLELTHSINFGGLLRMHVLIFLFSNKYTISLSEVLLLVEAIPAQPLLRF